ncbi:MAG: prenyltransferase [Pyrinomonadaceae bacterium]|nr:prenyltransferase [Pyrinomonadaceae bacterium]
MSRLSFIFKISRPRFWIYVFGPFLIGAVAAIDERSDLLSPELVVFAIYFLLPANLLIYGINDIFDYETDRLNPKKEDYEALVTPSERKGLIITILILNFPFVLGAFYLGTRPAAALFGFLFFSIFYSAPPFRAKAKPVIDSVFNILYVFPGILAYVLITDDIPAYSTIAAAGFWTMAMHAYSAIPDIDSDNEAGVSTVATLLGSNGTLLFCLFCYAVSAVLSFSVLGPAAIGFALIYFAMIMVSYQLSRSNKLFAAYRYFPIINTTVGFALFWIIAYPKLG